MAYVPVRALGHQLLVGVQLRAEAARDVVGAAQGAPPAEIERGTGGAEYAPGDEAHDPSDGCEVDGQRPPQHDADREVGDRSQEINDRDGQPPCQARRPPCTAVAATDRASQRRTPRNTDEEDTCPAHDRLRGLEPAHGTPPGRRPASTAPMNRSRLPRSSRHTGIVVVAVRRSMRTVPT